MGWRNKVVWSEGMLLQPQHFQQNERWLEHALQRRFQLVAFAQPPDNVHFEMQISLGQRDQPLVAITAPCARRRENRC